MARPNSPKAPGYLASHVRMQFQARSSQLEREQAILRGIDAARAELDNARSRPASAQLEILTEAIVQLVDAQAAAVAQMRADGYSWAQIGSALGLTKQAAQSRFGRSA